MTSQPSMADGASPNPQKKYLGKESRRDVCFYRSILNLVRVLQNTLVFL